MFDPHDQSDSNVHHQGRVATVAYRHLPAPSSQLPSATVRIPRARFSHAERAVTTSPATVLRQVATGHDHKPGPHGRATARAAHRDVPSSIATVPTQ